ncbi:MAG: HAMP domain-containing histidine kinase [Motiliproteus sp.]|nr:HAMP domain-containing histidine kinase [Motiliproteus sp.]MCW9054134.1 HAMP domain-containing histidine kinase [Motiliproteus sp.]
MDTQVTDSFSPIGGGASKSELLTEIDRLQKIIYVLMDRAEQGVNSEATDFSLFQTTITLEDKIRRRTEELESAMQQLDDSNAALEQSLQTLHQTQQQLIESEKMAALGHLVAGVAHEINTPVGVGVTAVSHLREHNRQIVAQVKAGQLTKGTLEDYLTDIQENSELVLTNLQRAHELVQRFKQAAVDQATYEQRVFDLPQLLWEVLDSLKPRLQESDVEFEVAGAGPLEIDSYPGVIAQVITNLVINTLEHAFDDGGSGKITVQLEHDGEQIYLYFRDTGKGISADVIDHVFEPFYTTRRGEGGTGLGLHISYNLCSEVLGGSLECLPSPAVGAEFLLKLPLIHNSTEK